MNILEQAEGIRLEKFVNKLEFISTDHTHPYYEMVYVKHPSFNYLIGDKIISPVSASLILVDKDTFHHPIASSTGKHSYTIIQFYEKMIAPELQQSLYRLFQNQLFIIDNEKNDSLLIDILVSKLYTEYCQEERTRDIMLKYQINELVELCSRFSLHHAQVINKEAPSLVEQAMRYINANLLAEDHSLLSLDYVASLFHMSPCSFSRLFKKEAGIGFKQYELSARILYAKKMLADGTHSISEVAYMSGFTDSNYFSYIFKKITSATPSEYIKFVRNIQ